MSFFQKIKSLFFSKSFSENFSEKISQIMQGFVSQDTAVQCFYVLKKVLILTGTGVCLIFHYPMAASAQENDIQETADIEGAPDADEVTDAKRAPDADEVTDAKGVPGEDVAKDNSLVFKKDIFHKHIGSASGGGCYSICRTGTKTEEIPCGGSMVYWPELGTSTCSRCAASYFGDQSHRGCWHSTTKTTSYTYYDLGCQKGPDTLLGTVTVKQSTGEWVKSLLLTAEYENTGNMQVYDKAFIWNGAEATDNSTYEVTSSGIYTLQLHAEPSANTQDAMITVDVRNVDVTAPLIKAHTQEPISDWVKEGVLVTLTETTDLQPDGSSGSGLHEQPYSYDEGITWTDEASHCYEENGAYTILLRDRLENISSYEVSFGNIDNTAPTIETVEYDHTKNIPSLIITVTASDLQPDGSSGSGLHEQPYSFDGGKTWSEDNTYLVKQNGVYQIAVRDRLGNTAFLEEKIQNIDCTGPVIHYTMVSESWTNKDVSVYVSASDLNEDKTEGVGLADTWYSVNGGKNWSNKEVLTFEENTEFTITARDKLDNYSTTHIKIMQIDKEQPWASLSMEVKGTGRDLEATLQAYGGDAYSGIPEECFSWDRGASYSAKSSVTVKENGIYQVYVRDKAGNSNNAVIEVDVFPALFPLIVQSHEELAESEPEETETEIQEREMAETVVSMKERIEKKADRPVYIQKQDRFLEDLILFLLGILALLLLLWLGILFYSRTIAVYVRQADGRRKYLGRIWISCKEERFIVRIHNSLVERATTTRFLFKPSCFFADAHKGEEIHFLFPEGVCMTLPIERNMEME